MTPEEQANAKKGVLLAIGAYTMWGVAPIYFKSITFVPALEILSHRVIWSFFFLAIIIHFSHQWRNVASIFQSKSKMLYLFATAILIGGNWLIFIWAVNSNHMLDASLGYYINPLINVLFGMMFLGERLRKLQWLAVTLAAIGVIIQIALFGSVPVVAFSLAISFAFYGLLRKKVHVNGQTGLFIETLVLLPIAFIYLTWFADSATSSMTNNNMNLNLLLISAGIVTTLPLLCFTGAATKLKLSTLGFFQYIGPSFMFLLAVLMYGEAFSADKAITFVFIWGALVIFSYDGLAQGRKRKASVVTAK